MPKSSCKRHTSRSVRPKHARRHSGPLRGLQSPSKRPSSEVDDEQIESQITALKERIATDGAQIVDDMCFVDAGVSGATVIRPQLERLRDCAALGAIDQLYILSPDRLARKYAHQALLMEEFSGCGVQVVFLNHAIGATPEESLLLQIQGMIADDAERGIMQSHTATVAA